MKLDPLIALLVVRQLRRTGQFLWRQGSRDREAIAHAAELEGIARHVEDLARARKGGRK